MSILVNNFDLPGTLLFLMSTRGHEMNTSEHTCQCLDTIQPLEMQIHENENTIRFLNQIVREMFFCPEYFFNMFVL